MVQPAPIEPCDRDLPEPITVHATSEGRGWQGLAVSFQEVPPVAVCMPAWDDECIVVHRSNAKLRLRDGRRWTSELTTPGTVHLLPSGSDFDFIVEDRVETQTIILSRSILTEVASEFVTADPDQILLRQGLYRPPIEQLLLFDSIGAALQGDNAESAIFSEYVSRAIAAQLLFAWAADHGRMMAAPKRGRRRTVTRAIDFIQSNLGTKITIQRIADAVGVGTTTLCREFKLELGVAPHQVVTDLRLKRARHLLKQAHSSLPDVATQCGFSSQQHMTITFREHLGLTPGAYRKSITD